MRGCECCGQVPGELALQSSGVSDGSVTMGFLAKFFFFSFLCSGGNRVFNAGLHAAEFRQSRGGLSVMMSWNNCVLSVGGLHANGCTMGTI